MKNILLLCLSPLSPYAQLNKYCAEIDGSTVFFEGSMTNEAPAKYIIDMLRAKGERLDKIVLICSNFVKTNIREDAPIPAEAEVESGTALSHLELFRRLIDKYARSADRCYSITPIEYIEVPIPDLTNDFQVSESVIDAANEITSDGNDVQLFIDFNGGQRYIAFMILSIANLMKIRGVKVPLIMTMNFDTKVNGVVPIQNMASLFESYDLISGINEYINYGRIGGLKRYFAPAGEEIQSLLGSLETFSNNLQLCRTSYIMSNKSALLAKLYDYVKKSDDITHNDTYSQLFSFVISDILDGMRDLLGGTLPEIIRWCVQKEFIQQALTFCSEEMPEYFVSSGIYAPTEEELSEFNEFVDTLKVAHPVPRDLMNFKRDVQSGRLKTGYHWFVNYLPFSGENPSYGTVISDFKSKLMSHTPSYEQLFIPDSERFSFNMFDMKSIPGYKKQITDVTKAAAKLLWHYEKDSGRVSSCIKDKSILREILLVYQLLKKQRNSTNHASGGDSSADWNYKHLCYMLNRFSEVLLTVAKE